MKKLLIVAFAISTAVGASAQKVIHGGGGHIYYYRPQVVYGVGAYVPLYPYPYFGYYYPYYNPYYYPYGPAYGYRPSRLTLQVEDIKMDYHDRITSVRHDKTMSRQERKEKVRALKNERDAKIEDLKSNYYKQK
jgi:hypothetical protein